MYQSKEFSLEMLFGDAICMNQKNFLWKFSLEILRVH